MVRLIDCSPAARHPQASRREGREKGSEDRKTKGRPCQAVCDCLVCCHADLYPVPWLLRVSFNAKLASFFFPSVFLFSSLLLKWGHCFTCVLLFFPSLTCLANLVLWFPIILFFPLWEGKRTSVSVCVCQCVFLKRVCVSKECVSVLYAHGSELKEMDHYPTWA